MCDTLVILNLHYFKRDSYISVICQAIIYAVEDRKADADTHLAVARSQNTGTGILGIYTKDEGQSFNGCLFRFIIIVYIKCWKENRVRRRRKKKNRLHLGMALLVVILVVVGLTRTLEDRSTNETFKNQNIEITDGEKTQEDNSAETQNIIDNPNIRVLLMTNGYRGTVHPEVILTSKSDMKLYYGEKTETIKAGEKLTIKPDNERFTQGKITIESEKKITISSLERGYGTPSYSGTLELWSTAEGVVIINELPVETYLCGVVPSEMPASYELEALKAQAVCARSYAYRQMEEYGYPEYEAHVNDSTDYQVYGNSKQQDSTKKAVKETCGETVRYKGEIVTTYYYSTSCGRTTTVEAWGTKLSKKNAYLQSVNVCDENGDYEKNLPWYEWTATIPVETLSNLIGLNTGKDIGTLKSVKVTKRGPGDIALKIKAVGEKGSVEVETENKIRAALGGSGYKIEKQDGTVVESSKLLPSAFFTIKKAGDTFVIEGGGYGHGIGMSQNGANEMAKEGKDYKEILKLFYQGTTIE